MGDAVVFRKFSDFMSKCQNKTEGNNWNVLDNQDMIRLLCKNYLGAYKTDGTG